MNPHVRLLVGWSVGPSVFISFNNKAGNAHIETLFLTRIKDFSLKENKVCHCHASHDPFPPNKDKLTKNS